MKRNPDFEDKVNIYDLNINSDAIHYNTVKGIEEKTKPGGALMSKA